MAKWTPTDTKLEIHERQNNGCINTFLLVFIFFDVLGCIGYAYLNYLKHQKVPIDTLFLTFIGLGIIFFFILINQQKNIKNWFLIINKKEEKFTIIKGTNNKGFSIGFDQIAHIKLTPESRQRISTASDNLSNKHSNPINQIYLEMKDRSILWVDSFDTKEEAKKNVLLLSKFIQRPVINMIDDEKIITNEIEYTVQTPKIATKSPFIKVNTLKGNNKELTVIIRQSLKNKIMNYFALAIVSLFPLAIIKAPYNTMELFILGVFGFIILLFSLIMILNNKKYTLIKSDTGLKVQLKHSLPIKKVQSIYLELQNLHNVQIHRLDNGHYWMSLLLNGHNLNLGEIIKFNIGAFSKETVKKTLNDNNQQLGLWEVPASQKDSNGLSFENLVFIQQWINN